MDAETFTAIKRQASQKASVFATVKNWLEDIAEHLRKNGVVS